MEFLTIYLYAYFYTFVYFELLLKLLLDRLVCVYNLHIIYFGLLKFGFLLFYSIFCISIRSNSIYAKFLWFVFDVDDSEFITKNAYSITLHTRTFYVFMYCYKFSDSSNEWNKHFFLCAMKIKTIFSDFRYFMHKHNHAKWEKTASVQEHVNFSNKVLQKLFFLAIQRDAMKLSVQPYANQCIRFDILLKWNKYRLAEALPVLYTAYPLNSTLIIDCRTKCCFVSKQPFFLYLFLSIYWISMANLLVKWKRYIFVMKNLNLVRMWASALTNIRPIDIYIENKNNNITKKKYHSRINGASNAVVAEYGKRCCQTV